MTRKTTWTSTPVPASAQELVPASVFAVNWSGAPPRLGKWVKQEDVASTKRKILKRRPQIAISFFSELMARVKDAIEKHLELFQLAPQKTIKPAGHDFGVSQAGASRFTPISVHMKNTTRCHSLVGFEEPAMNSLVDLQAFDHEKDKQLKVVPIYGLAGAGKSTLARTLYDKYGGKFQCRAFLQMSRNPDMRKLLTGVLSQIKAPPGYAAFWDVHDLIDSIIKHLTGKRFFIIIDDLWSTSAWDVIRRAFPHGPFFSRIITTTKIEDVALACCGYQSEYVFKMRPLNDDQSRKLFFNVIFRPEGDCSQDFEEVSNGIIRKCGGLPLAIVHIASLLASQPNLEQWKRIRDSLPSIMRTNPTSAGPRELISDRVIGFESRPIEREPKLEEWKHIQKKLSSTPEGLKEVISFIYNNFPSRLKTCLLYFSMYPDGSVIKKDELVKQWVAEGFLSAVDGQDKEEIARAYFDELVGRGMIQAVDTSHNGKVLTCTVHHILLNLIRYKSMEENLVITVNYFQPVLALPDKVRRLSVQFGGAKSAKIPENIRMTQVRSLLFCGFFKCVPWIVDYRLLRVLILHIWADQHETSFDLTRICELFRLRYLKIECDIITVDLPDQIRGLQYLETLLVDAKLSAVPSDIVHLNKLLHLQLPSESILPHGVSYMTSLRTLGYFDMGSNSQDKVMDLCKLTNLQDLQLTCSTVQSAENLKMNMELFGLILEQLRNLKSLTLVPTACSSSICIPCGGLIREFPAAAHLQRHELLPRICIFASLPKWTGKLSRLCVLKIAVGELLMKDIEILQGLPSLNALSLSARIVQFIVFNIRGFRVLKYFKFMHTAPCLSFLGGAMPNVQKLRVGFNASRMKQHNWGLFGFQHLTSLREISVKLGGIAAHEFAKRKGNLSSLMAAVNHQNGISVNIKFVDQLFHDIYYGTQDEVPDFPPKKDEVSGEDEHNQANIRITAQSESSLCLPVAGRRVKFIHSSNKTMLEIIGKDDVHGVTLDQVLASTELTKLKTLILNKCPPLKLKYLLMLTSLKKLVFKTSDRLVEPLEGHGEVEWQLPVEHLVVQKLYGASGKELTELLTHLPSLSRLEIKKCEKITQLAVGVDLQQKTSAIASDVEQEKEDGLMLLFPAHICYSLQKLTIIKCPELVLVDPPTFLPPRAAHINNKTETRERGLQALRSLQKVEISWSPKFLSVYLSSSSPSLHLFPPSLQSLWLSEVEDMGTLEPLSNLTSLTILDLRNRGEDLRCEGLGPLLAKGGKLSKLIVSGSPRFFDGWDPNPKQVVQDDEGEEQKLQLVSPLSSTKLQELETNDAAGLLAAPICRFLSSSLTNPHLYGTKEMERFRKEQEDALHLLASLQELEFWLFKKLQHLPAGLHKLTNLKRLKVCYCPALRSLPKDGFPKSLQKINILYCGNKELKQQCTGLTGTIPEIIL